MLEWLDATVAMKLCFYRLTGQGKSTWELFFRDIQRRPETECRTLCLLFCQPDFLLFGLLCLFARIISFYDMSWRYTQKQNNLWIMNPCPFSMLLKNHYMFK